MSAGSEPLATNFAIAVGPTPKAHTATVVTKMKKALVSTMVQMRARGIARRGLRVSSPSDAAPSNPALESSAKVSASEIAPAETPSSRNADQSTVWP